jgi:putative nucleotidyltransferase with HDIG domain
MSRTLRAYIIIVIAGGLAALAYISWQGPYGLRFAGLGDWIFFLCMGCLLDMMVVPMAGGTAVSAGFAAFLAYLVLAGPAAAASVAALATISTDLVTRRKVPVYRTLFNIAHITLSLLAAGAVYRALGGEYGRIALSSDVAQLLAAAAVIFLVETTAISIVFALERRLPLAALWVNNVRAALPLDGALTGIGILLAGLYGFKDRIASGFGPAFVAVVVLIPSALLYYASRLYSDMRRVYARTLRTLASVVEAKDPGSEGHAIRVAELAFDTAQALNCPMPEAEMIHYAGYLHDVGKVGIPGDLLRKDEPSDEERDQLRRHPEIGAEILKPVEFLRPVADIIRYHHEHLDGTGVFGLRGEDIPLGARIIHAIERYDGLVYGRHGRRPLSPLAAIDYLRQRVGTEYQANVVDALERTLVARGLLDARDLVEVLHAV